MRKLTLAIAALSTTLVLSLSAAPNTKVDAATVRITDWSTERITDFGSNASVVEETQTQYIYERYLWHSGKTWRATSKRLVPADYSFNKLVNTNSYSGAGNGTKKYNIRRSIAYSTPVAEDKGGGYTVVGSDGQSFHAWCYYTVTQYRYIITEADAPVVETVVEPVVEPVVEKPNYGPTSSSSEINSAIQSYIDNAKGSSAKEWGGGSGTQCVELPKHYIDTVLGCKSHYLGLGNGNTLYAGIARKYPSKFTAIEYYDGFIPCVGDILSLNGSDKRYGHAVIVKSVDPDAMTCVILEQWKGSKTVRERTIPIQGKNSGTKNGIIGCARVK